MRTYGAGKRTESSGPPKAAAANMPSFFRCAALIALGGAALASPSCSVGGDDYDFASGGEAGADPSGSGGKAPSSGGQGGGAMTGGRSSGGGAPDEGGAGGAAGNETGGAPANAGAGEGGESGSGTAGMSTGGTDGGAAGGGGAGGGAQTGGMAGLDGGGGQIASDTTPPTIVSVSPSNGETGIYATSDVVVTFSEPMNRAETQASYQSPDIGAATFSWNATSTVLTIQPSSDLEYAQGDDPDDPGFDARLFEVTISQNAQDEAGNPLLASYDWSFATWRQVTQTMGPLPANGYVAMYVIIPDGIYITCDLDNTPVVFAGDQDDGATSLGFLSVIVFDLSPLPTGIESFVSATLSGEQTMVEGAPYAELGGAVEISHIYMSYIDEAAWTEASLEELGDFSASASLGVRSADVLDAVREDYELRSDRGDQSQYRLRFPTASSNDGTADLALFQCSTFGIEVSYLIE